MYTNTFDYSAAKYRLVLDQSRREQAMRNSTTVGAYHAKTHLPELLEKVEAGHEITITRHGMPVARLVPIRRGPSSDERAAAIGRIRKLGQTLSLRGLKVKEMLAEGRK